MLQRIHKPVGSHDTNGLHGQNASLEQQTTETFLLTFSLAALRIICFGLAGAGARGWRGDSNLHCARSVQLT